MAARSFLLLLVLGSLEAAYLPPGSPTAAFVKNMVLVYMDSRSLPPNTGEFVVTEAAFSSLVSCTANEEKLPLFDAVQFMGYDWIDGACFWPLQCPRPMNQTDWEQIMSLWMTMGAEQLNPAVQGSGATAPVTLFVTIPYPDTRQNAWGYYDGRLLNFNITEDRIAAVRWWIDTFMVNFVALHLDLVRLQGFYWYLEDLVDYDFPVIEATRTYLNDLGYFLNWIPSYQGAANATYNVSYWQRAGFDFVTAQPNYAFYDVSLQRFENTSLMMNEYTLGVEMELPLTVRNQLINLNATESFYAYLSAALQYDWMQGALKTYYTGNDFMVMANSTNATLAHMYRDLCLFVNGQYSDPHVHA